MTALQRVLVCLQQHIQVTLCIPVMTAQSMVITTELLVRVKPAWLKHPVRKSKKEHDYCCVEVLQVVAFINTQRRMTIHNTAKITLSKTINLALINACDKLSRL